MSNTPRTDAFAEKLGNGAAYLLIDRCHDFARELERELAEAKRTFTAERCAELMDALAEANAALSKVQSQLDETLRLAAGWRDQHSEELQELREMEKERTEELQSACSEIERLKRECDAWMECANG